MSGWRGTSLSISSPDIGGGAVRGNTGLRQNGGGHVSAGGGIGVDVIDLKPAGGGFQLGKSEVAKSEVPICKGMPGDVVPIPTLPVTTFKHPH